jgi:hypothetical protein
MGVLSEYGRYVFDSSGNYKKKLQKDRSMHSSFLLPFLKLKN